MAQELFSVIQRVQGIGLFAHRPGQDQLDVRTAKVRRKMNFGNRRRPHPRVGHFVTDQFIQLFANALGNTFGAMRIQISGYRPNGQFHKWYFGCWSNGCNFARADVKITETPEP